MKENLIQLTEFTSVLYNAPFCIYSEAIVNCRQCLAYVVVPMLKKEIEEFLQLWNTHPIRCNKKAGIPHGIPNDLYVMPSDKGNN